MGEQGAAWLAQRWHTGMQNIELQKMSFLLDLGEYSGGKR